MKQSLTSTLALLSATTQLFLIIFLDQTTSTLAQNTKYSSTIPTPVQSIRKLSDLQITNDPKEVSITVFNSRMFEVYSIKVEKQNITGSWIDCTLNDYSAFEDDGIFNLGGCTSYQTQSELKPLMHGSIGSNLKFSDYIHFPTMNKFLLLTSNYNIFSLQLQNLPKQDTDISTSINKLIDFSSLLTTSTTTVEPWIFGIYFNLNGYIFTSQKAWQVSASPSKIADLQILLDYQPRTQIFDIFQEGNSVWVSAGSDGIDIYYIIDSLNFKHITTISKSSNNPITGFPASITFSIQRIRIVTQGTIKLVIIQEEEEGLHILQLTTLSSASVSMTYLYFIPIQHISGFDATSFTLAITLSTRTYQSALEIFFDSTKYYINFFQSDELAVYDVVLDRNTKAGIWIGEDVLKSFRHSIYKGNLQYSKNVYEDFTSVQGDNQVYFFTKDSLTVLLALSMNRIQLFNITNAVSKVYCSSSESGTRGYYRVSLISPYCDDSLHSDSSETSADHLFNSCLVQKNIEFFTNTIVIDSSNLGMILGIVFGVLGLLIIVIFILYCKYKKNQKDISLLQVSRDNYLSVNKEQSYLAEQQQQLQEQSPQPQHQIE